MLFIRRWKLSGVGNVFNEGVHVRIELSSSAQVGKVYVRSFGSSRDIQQRMKTRERDA